MDNRMTFDGALAPDRFHLDVTRLGNGRFEFRTRNRTNYGVTMTLSKEDVAALVEFLTKKPMPEEPQDVGTLVEVDGRRYLRSDSLHFPWRASRGHRAFEWPEFVTPDSDVKVVA